MEKTIQVILAAHPPSAGQLTQQHAVVVHNLYQAAETLADEILRKELRGLGVQTIFQPAFARKALVDEIYYRLLAKKPDFAPALLAGAYDMVGVQLALPF